ncbi:MAG: hypothetical protein AB2A00_26760 [Myxococcota bacterium]
MRCRFTLALLPLLLAGCEACNGGNGDGDAGGPRSGLGESCTRTADCSEGLACVALTCVELPSDAGAPDAARLGGLGDSCLRTADCLSPYRCVAQVCSVVPDAGPPDASPPDATRPDAAALDASVPDAAAPPDDAGTRDAARVDAAGTDAGASLDAAVHDVGFLRAEGCAFPGPTPRGTGGCCRTSADCASGMCIRGMCSAVCQLDEHCAVTAPATPFRSSVTLACVDHYQGGGRVCLPGSLAPCEDDEGCADDESCVFAYARSDGGGLVTQRRCTANRVGGKKPGGSCTLSADCEVFEPGAASCVGGICRTHCDEQTPCAHDGECVIIPVADGGAPPTGYCLGPHCGSPPASQDTVCGDGGACVPQQSPVSSSWNLRCEPLVSPGIPVGGACEPSTAATCDHRMCVEDRCTQLCHSDVDCPSTLPFCAVRPLDTAASGVFAVCVAPPPNAQACRREGDCGGLGCRFLSDRSYFAHCVATGSSDPADMVCGPGRTCPPGQLCLPDTATGTMRCAQRLNVGARCSSRDTCRSGPCMDRDGVPASTADAMERRTFCSARCQTAADCGQNMECRSTVSTVVPTDEDTPPLVQPLCWPLTPALNVCSLGVECLGSGRGDSCDPSSGACFTANATVGAACLQDHDCELGLRCGSPTGEPGLCVRDGCIPGTSGGGCAGDEVCVPTSPLTAECRRACASGADCLLVNAELVCREATDVAPAHCGRP